MFHIQRLKNTLKTCFLPIVRLNINKKKDAEVIFTKSFTMFMFFVVSYTVHPDRGLSVARQNAMITYRTHSAYAAKFHYF